MTATYRVVCLLCCVAICFILFPNVYGFLDETVQKFILKAFKTTAHTFSFWSRLSFWPSFRERGSVALLFGCKFLTKDKDF